MMDIAAKNRQIANSYYNLGLEKAKVRDLSGAAQCLKKSLHFSKYQTDARNLLGLIYYENGEVADALVQWVISLNLQPENNLADHYLDEIQRKPGQLETESQNVKTFNQALWHAQNGSDDLAILQLARVVAAKPHFVKAHLLLALLYMRREDYNKAGRSLFKILQIDKSNPKALYYMSLVKQNTGRADAEKRKMIKAFSHRQMQDDDVILPPTYKENTGWQSIINIGIGLVLGAVMVVFLIMPARERALNYEHNQEMQSYTDKLNLANQETDKLKLQVEDYQKQKEDAEGQLNDLKGDSGSTVNQYAALAKILDAYRKGDTNTAVLTYVDMDQSKITDDSSVAILNEIKADMDANAPTVLMAAAAQSNSVGDYDSALRYYERYMEFNDKNPEVIYNMGMVYKAKGDTDNANQMFGQVIMNFADSEFAEKAKEERGY